MEKLFQSFLRIAQIFKKPHLICAEDILGNLPNACFHFHRNEYLGLPIVTMQNNTICKLI